MFIMEVSAWNGGFTDRRHDIDNAAQLDQYPHTNRDIKWWLAVHRVQYLTIFDRGNAHARFAEHSGGMALCLGTLLDPAVHRLH